MIRRKKKPLRRKSGLRIKADKQKIRDIINNLSVDWSAEERETSILFDHQEKVVHLETSYPATARRWFENLWGDPDVKFDDKADSFKITVPWSYCRQPDLILMAKHRKYNG